MIESCRADFDFPGGMSYLNAAYMSPMPRAALEAGLAGVAEKARPWTRDRAAAEATVERCRAMAADLVGAEPDDVAIVGSVSYGVAVACANLVIAPGSRLVVLEDEHHSVRLSLRALAERTGAVLDPVLRPGDGDWTAAILAKLESSGGPVALAALTPVHWIDGSVIDLERIAPRLRALGARLFVDATQSVGVLPLDAAALQADFVAFPMYKWLLGPYGIAFLYVARAHQHGRPLEEHAFNHRDPVEPLNRSAVRSLYTTGARRFDRGELETYVTVPTALAALTYVSRIESEARTCHLRALTAALRDGLEGLGVESGNARFASPHIVSFRAPADREGQVVRAFDAAGVSVTYRYGLFRVSPHVYNGRDDIDRLLGALRQA